MLLRGINAPAQFRNYLCQHSQIPNLMLFFGDDPYIRERFTQCGKDYFKTRGYSSFITFTSDNFKWELLQNELLTHSLLAENQLVILNFADSSLPREIISNITEIGQATTQNKALIITGPHLTKEKENSVWFKKLTAFNCLYLPFYAPSADNLHYWFSEEAQDMGLVLNYDSAQLLSDFFEGNLSGGIQALQTCQMLGKKNISREDLLFVTGDCNFNVYDYTDDLIKENTSKALKILTTLRSSGEDPALIVYELNRIIHFMLALKQAEYHQEDTRKIYQEHRIMTHQSGIYRQLCTHTNVQHLNNLIRMLDLIQKNRMEFHEKQAWRNIETLTAFFFRDQQLASYLSMEC